MSLWRKYNVVSDFRCWACSNLQSEYFPQSFEWIGRPFTSWDCPFKLASCVTAGSMYITARLSPKCHPPAGAEQMGPESPLRIGNYRQMKSNLIKICGSLFKTDSDGWLDCNGLKFVGPSVRTIWPMASADSAGFRGIINIPSLI